MGCAWVGPLHWIQWAGGHRHLIPRGWRSGPGGDRLPDCRMCGTGPSSRPGGRPLGCGGREGARPFGRGWMGRSWLYGTGAASRPAGPGRGVAGGRPVSGQPRCVPQILAENRRTAGCRRGETIAWRVSPGRCRTLVTFRHLPASGPRATKGPSYTTAAPSGHRAPGTRPERMPDPARAGPVTSSEHPRTQALFGASRAPLSWQHGPRNSLATAWQSAVRGGGPVHPADHRARSRVGRFPRRRRDGGPPWPGGRKGVEAAMRWLVGSSSTATGAVPTEEARTLVPVGAQLLWGDPDPLWAVGDWRPDEVRVVQADAQTRLAVFGVCGATDDQLRVGLFAARGGALRHLTAWPGSYTAVVQVGRRVTVTGDLAGARPVFHTPLGGRYGVRHRRPPARRPHRGGPRHRASGRAAGLPGRARGAGRGHAVRGRTAGTARPRARPARRQQRHHLVRTDGLAGGGGAPTAARAGRRRGAGRADRGRTGAADRGPARPGPGRAGRAGPGPGAGHGAGRAAGRARRPGPRRRRRPFRRECFRHSGAARGRAAGGAGHGQRAR
ncbi:hypothetical protein SRIMM317S_05279 [Streptomyces rimosus subsp. rimosus]